MDAATQRMLKMAVATEEQGAATLEQMYEQGHQLRRIQDDQKRVDHNLDTSDRILKNMGSFLGWRTWGMSSKIAKSEQGKAKMGEIAEGAVDISDGGGHAAAGAGAKGGGKGRCKCSGASDALAAGAGGSSGGAPPDAFDVIGGIMGKLEQQALAMNAELKAQADDIDTVTEKTEHQQERVKKDTKRTAAVGGKKAKAAASEGMADAVLNAASGSKRPVSNRMAALKAMQGM